MTSLLKLRLLRCLHGVGAEEKVEVAAVGGLVDVIEKEAAVAAAGGGGGGVAGGAGGKGAAGGGQVARRAASSSSLTWRWRRRLATSSSIGSPSRTRARGPPIALSGDTWRTIVPKAVPLIRPSEMRTMSRIPCFSSLPGMGKLPTSGIPSPPT